MARIMAIDYGLKRTGIAVTDPLQIIATGLTTVESPKLIPFLKEYFRSEVVELILIGEPKNWDDTDTHATPLVRQVMVRLAKEFPAIPLKPVDERFTSKMASRAMIDMGMKKKQRRNKALVDEIAATIMLQDGWGEPGNDHGCGGFDDRAMITDPGAWTSGHFGRPPKLGSLSRGRLGNKLYIRNFLL